MLALYIAVPLLLAGIAAGLAYWRSVAANKARNSIRAGVGTLVVAGLLSAGVYFVTNQPPASTVPPVVVVETKIVEVPGPVQTVIVEITSTPGAPAQTGTPIPPPVTVSDFPKTPAEVIKLFNLRDENGLSLSESWVVPCPWGESECWEVKMSPVFADNPWNVWVEAFRHYPGTLRPGGYVHPERSGLPPMEKDVLIDSGLTIRPQGVYAAAPTPGVMTWDAQIEVEIPGFPETARQAADFYGISMTEAYPYACGEGHCFIFRPATPFKSFNARNGSCWMDGYRVTGGQIRPGFEREADAAKISVPPNYTGSVVEFVVRPCVEDQSAMLVMYGGSTATPMPSLGTPVPVAGFPTTVEEVTRLFKVTNGVVAGCSGEANCWQISPTVSGGFFSITNVSSCWQSGYTRTAHELRQGQTDLKTSLPAGWTGEAESAQLRPCR